MYKLYQKVSKTIDYPLGAKSVEEERNPFADGACLLCISPQEYARHIFGVTKVGMEMARMRVKGAVNAGFDISDVPVSFLNLMNEGSRDNLEEFFVDTYLVPLVSSHDGGKIDISEAMKSMRNVNMMAYCNGTEKIIDILRCLYGRMGTIGYSEQEISQISSQICVFPFSTEMDLQDLGGVTYVDFLDINDDEIYSPNINEEIEEATKTASLGEVLTIHSKTQATYTINGTGCHKLRQFTKEGRAMPVCVSKIISNALENSIRNSNSGEFYPIDTVELTKGCPEIMLEAEAGITQDELMQKLDKGLEYGGAKRLNESELALISQLEAACDKITSLDESLKYAHEANKTLESRIDNMLETSRNISTKSTHARLLHVSGRWQFSKAELDEINNTPTDAEQIGKLQGMLHKALGELEKVGNKVFHRKSPGNAEIDR